MIGRRREKKKR